MRVGEAVGARRWPSDTSHPSNWGAPHLGRVLDVRDPRAWAGTIAFPTPTPDQSAVDEYVDRLLEEQGAFAAVPVLWNFNNTQVVFWEREEVLVPYATDYTNWLRAKAMAFAAEEARKENKACA